MLDGLPVAWFAPTYKYLSQAWRDFIRLLTPRHGQPKLIRYKNRSEYRIELITGGSIEFWSLQDPDAGRSRKYQRVVVDEAAKARHLEVAWTEAIRPTLTDLKGDAWFLSTPKGRNYFWKLFTQGLNPDDRDWASFRTGALTGIPTVTNPHIDPEEVDAARRQLPERVYQQEYLATFLEEAAGVFRGVAACVDKGRTAFDPPKPDWNYCHGLDLARKEDFTVLPTLDPSGRQAAFDRFNEISWERQIAAVKGRDGAYHGDWWIDSTGIGDPIFERLLNEDLAVSGYQFTNASKNRLIDNLAMGIERGKLRLMDLEVQTNELLSFEYEMTPSRNIRMSAPPGMNDDCVIGLALAYWGLTNTPWVEVL
jgi:hypothetical protein